MAGKYGAEEFILCDIRWKEDGEIREGVVFSEHSSEGEEYDDLVFFSGFSADELRAAEGGNGVLGEDFDIVCVRATAGDIRELI